MPTNDATVTPLHKERLRREHKARVKSRMVAKGVEKVSDTVETDPILEHYPAMLAFGAKIVTIVSLDEVKAVQRAWSEACAAAERGEVEVSDADVARWYEHRQFAEAFLALVYCCSGKDADGDLPPSAYLGVMNP